MAGIPHTLFGTIGFILTVGFLMGSFLSEQSINIQNAQKDAMNNINKLGATDSIAGTFFNMGDLIISELNLGLVWISAFVGFILMLPTELHIFGLLLILALTIAWLKFGRGVWDF